LFELESRYAGQVGRLVESAVGAHFANAAPSGEVVLFCSRERNEDVDFVASSGRRVVAIEVKNSRAPTFPSGTKAFEETFALYR